MFSERYYYHLVLIGLTSSHRVSNVIHFTHTPVTISFDIKNHTLIADH
jgi:hypothetical protein